MWYLNLHTSAKSPGQRCNTLDTGDRRVYMLPQFFSAANIGQRDGLDEAASWGGGYEAFAGAETSRQRASNLTRVTSGLEARIRGLLLEDF